MRGAGYGADTAGRACAKAADGEVLLRAVQGGATSVRTWCEFNYVAPGTTEPYAWTRVTNCRDATHMLEDLDAAVLPELAMRFTRVMIRYGEHHLVSLPNHRPIQVTPDARHSLSVYDSDDVLITGRSRTCACDHRGR